MAKQPRIYSIKEITRYIRMKLESDNLLGDVWLRGEISNFTHHSSGHMYFTLKDSDSRLKCIMFASHNQRLPFIPREGAKVMARGNFSVYERDGNYQFYVTQMQPDGIGSLYLAFEQLKKKLEAEGLFDPARKRSIPRLPKAIGVVTSPTGAAVRDILITLERRFPNVHVSLVPVLVQGPQAAPAIVKAIELLNREQQVDVLIVGRGGGSLEELWAFNEESVARAIAGSLIPVISAVGHETDYTIADFVADLRAATPTAAAELAVPHLMEMRQQVDQASRRLAQALRHTVQVRKERLARVRRSPLFMHPRRYLLEPAQRLDRLKEQLRTRFVRRSERSRERLVRLQGALKRSHPGARAEAAADRLTDLQKQLEGIMRLKVRDRRSALGSAVRQLDALSPLKVMARGYGLIYDEKEEHLVKSIQDVQPGDLVHVRLADGSLDCHVWGMKGEGKSGGTEGNDTNI
ncbi:exodeoxyribonuclease VII large subunit [Paenibacillus sambharensis]|uniref:Exodeoxyribonuclease 7 large subunit n=1 Tax=Paenibacillus sambharensis TaxID=1803190 RepID=A0A2W1LNR1_9BACL|nr:exodeoxyribonuclease VII large subunit [Paenibacillus sambharensis]PZD93441.1 exodeoxyribonuclease VII large subunit [Paenibacillus sambharensis]